MPLSHYEKYFRYGRVLNFDLTRFTFINKSVIINQRAFAILDKTIIAQLKTLVIMNFIHFFYVKIIIRSNYIIRLSFHGFQLTYLLSKVK